MLRTYALVAVLACLGCAAPSAAFAAKPGSLDTSFGTGGFALAGLTRPELGQGGPAPFPAGIVREPGGRLVVAGTLFTARPPTLFLVGFTSRGKLDPSFGHRGNVITNVAGKGEEVHSLVRQPNGRLVVGGTVVGFMMFARYSPSGRLDRSFGRGGVVRVSAGPGGDVVYALRPRTGGRILAAGATGAHGELVELRSDGRLNRAFGHGGKVALDLGPGRERLTGVVIDRQHRIVVSGSRGKTAFAARLTPSGALDRTFGTNGVASVPDASGGAVAIDAQGRVLLAGGSVQSGVNPSGGFLVARFTTRGRLDGSYASAGVLRTGLGSGAGAIVLDRAGRALLAGSGQAGDESCGILARTSGDGAFDPAFGPGAGGVSPPFPPDEPCVWDSQVFQRASEPNGGYLADLLLIPEGRIVVVGKQIPTYLAVPDVAVARYHS
jgi:uncharacterized delta-60 repeat protein